MLVFAALWVLGREPSGEPGPGRGIAADPSPAALRTDPAAAPVPSPDLRLSQPLPSGEDAPSLPVDTQTAA